MHLQKVIKSLKGLFLLNSLLFILTFSASNTFADFYVIAGSKGVGTKINALPYTIASPGFYFIAKDLVCVAGNHGIEITADNVTLDLMGFSLVGPGGSGSHSGIYMNGRANVEIRNGTVKNFADEGIDEFSSAGTGHRIINIRVKDNNSRGIILSGKSHLVEKCTAVSNGGYGIYASSGSTITGNTCYLNLGDGIYAHNGSTVTGNTCFDNGTRGILTSEGCTITGNTCYDNGSAATHHGIYAGKGSTIIGNTCHNNSGYGINLGGDNFIAQNTATGNNGGGTGGNISACGSGTCSYGLNHAP